MYIYQLCLPIILSCKTISTKVHFKIEVLLKIRGQGYLGLQ